MPPTDRALGLTMKTGVQFIVVQQISIELYAKPSFRLWEFSKEKKFWALWSFNASEKYIFAL